MAIEPLKWPEYVQHPNRLQRFLEGFPLIGPDRFAWRAIRKQLRDRPDDCLSLWKQDPQTLSARDVVVDALRDSFGWKSRNFIPADPCDILLALSAHSDGMDVLDFMCRIKKHFTIKLDADRWLVVKNMTLGEFVDAIVDKRWETLPKETPAENGGVSRLGCVVMLIPVLILIAVAVLTSRFAMSHLSPTAICRAFGITGIVGVMNAILGIFVWLRPSGKEPTGVIIASIVSLLLGLFLFLFVGAR